jgi:glycosyltransferase involved in cell wall biosynthesis
MNFLIITNVVHSQFENSIFGYAPYVREMNIWSKNITKLTVVAPISNTKPTAIDVSYNHQKIDFKPVAAFDFLSFFSTFKSLLLLPNIFFKIAVAMKNADHIHLRCPGNMGLLGCLVQIFFPNKKKTAKYAGNWDFNEPKPFSYKLQQWILNNTFLTKNIYVLVYGHWENSSKNILPFFTATYSETEIVPIEKLNFTTIHFVFAGMLVEGKNPKYAIDLALYLKKMGFNIILEIFGDGILFAHLKNYIAQENIENFIKLRGNQPQSVLKEAYQKAHFSILPSNSEGWPKAIAEAMFWGCVPIATNVSCVAEMLDFGNRGIILSKNLEADALKIKKIIDNQNAFFTMSNKAKTWSQIFTTEKFENAIKNLLS